MRERGHWGISFAGAHTRFVHPQRRRSAQLCPVYPSFYAPLASTRPEPSPSVQHVLRSLGFVQALSLLLQGTANTEILESAFLALGLFAKVAYRASAGHRAVKKSDFHSCTTLP